MTAERDFRTFQLQRRPMIYLGACGVCSKWRKERRKKNAQKQTSHPMYTVYGTIRRSSPSSSSHRGIQRIRTCEIHLSSLDDRVVVGRMCTYYIYIHAECIKISKLRAR